MSSSKSPKQQSNSRISRRKLLQAGGLDALHLGMQGMLSAAQGTGNAGSTEKSCIFILLCGGPSHLDSWDMKPEALDGIRGPFKPISTTVPGMQISELHTRLSKLPQHFCLIRSMTHPRRISNHFDAMHNCLSGQFVGPPDDSLYLGSVIAKVRLSRRNVVTNVWLIKCVGSQPVSRSWNSLVRGRCSSVSDICETTAD